MNIAWQHFSPWASLAGGMLIGLAAALLILFNGRIAGISGILGGLLRPRNGDLGWRIAFLAGLVGMPLLYQLWQALPPVQIDAGTPALIVAGLLVGMPLLYQLWQALPPVQIDAGTPALIVAGLLVGVGVRYGAGCTSGHGVCGLSRLSPRSLAATIAFMAAGFLTVYLLRHV